MWIDRQAADTEINKDIVTLGSLSMGKYTTSVMIFKNI